MVRFMISLCCPVHCSIQVASLTIFFLKSKEKKDRKPSLFVDNHSVLVFPKNSSGVLYFRTVVPLLALVGVICSDPSSFFIYTGIDIDSPRASAITMDQKKKNG